MAEHDPSELERDPSINTYSREGLGASTPSVVDSVVAFTLHAALTRGELGELTGYSPAAVTKAVRWLCINDLVMPAPLPPGLSAIGRPSLPLQASPLLGERVETEPLWQEAIARHQSESELTAIAEQLQVSSLEALAHIIEFYKTHHQ